MHKIPSLVLQGKSGPVIDPEQAWVLDGNSTATVMYDGLCYAVINQRPYVHTVSAELNPEIIVCGVHEQQWWGWTPVPATDEVFWHCWREAYAERNFDWSYELVGPEVNGNPERITRHVLKPHGTLHIRALQHPTLESIRAYLASRPIEGVVWWEDIWLESIRAYLASRPIEGVVWWEEKGNPLCRKTKVQQADFNFIRRAK